MAAEKVQGRKRRAEHTPSDEEEERENEYMAGAIMKIRLENFLIYDQVEVAPGPHLNVIIGPNATGKSTIVNAICLGLAGKTTILGRAKDTLAYIKNGCSRATIEIELHNPGGKNHKIFRVISKNARGSADNTWAINGKNQTQKQVEELVSSLNIQVSNLCQFLPQDRVADFVKMTNTELLLNTMKAADRSLYDMHVKLRDAQKVSQQLESDYAKVKESLEMETKLNAALERDVENVKERQTQLEKLQTLQFKRPWAEYDMHRVRFAQLKEERAAIKQRLKDAKAQNEPAQSALDDAKRASSDKHNAFKSAVTDITSAGRDFNNLNEKLKTMVDEVDEIENAFKSKESEEKRRQDKEKSLRELIEGIKAQIAAVQDVDLTSEIAALTQEVNRLARSKMEFQQRLDTLNRDKENNSLEIRSVEGELRQVRDVDAQKLNVVRRKDKHTYDAIIWLRRNSNLFQDIIFEPPMMTLNVPNSDNAKFLENNIKFADMKSFICLNPDDHEKLFKELDKLKLVTNTAIALQTPLSAFKPDKPIEQYRKYGFTKYLKDMVEGPEPVVAYLCSLSGLHNIPVGGNEVDQGIDIIPRECSELRRYLSATKSYNHKKSKYSGNVMTTVNDLRAANTLIHSVDEKRLTDLTEKLKVLQGEGRDLANVVTRLNEDLKDNEKKSIEAKSEKKTLIQKQNARKNHEERLATKEKNLKNIEKESVDIAKEKAVADARIKKVYAKRLNLVKEMSGKAQKMLDTAKRRAILAAQSYSLNVVVEKLQRELDEKSKLVHELETEYETKDTECNRTKRTANALKDEAKKAIGADHPSEALLASFSNLPSILEEIDAMIAEVQARVDLIIVDNDRSVLDEFNNRKKMIKTLVAKEARRKEEVIKHRDEIAEIKQNWLPPLQEIIAKIDKKVAEFFRDIKCAGEVNLKIPNDPEDYENYGIAISVKYGDNKPMKELTTFQSGGERSVATVLYMLSLQQLSKSPFRCVDEINQGMDAENERRIFELVVKTACCPNTPQYFLLTPKLLPDLLYTDRMSIHIVHNGPYMMDHKDWKIKEFIKRRGEFDDSDSDEPGTS